MKISYELKEKIERVLKNNGDMRDKLLSGNRDAIKKIGIISKQGIDPEDVVESYENNTVDYLYKKAKQLVELHEIYEELCYEAYRDNSEER